RARDPAAPADGMRVLVDRLWPRGLTKEQVAADLWLREAAPSTALRRWFGHQQERYAEFGRRYRAELEAHPEVLRQLDELGRRGRLTLLYDAADTEHNQARVLCRLLLERRAGAG
ncbi:MAG: DUF488 family protein, partial [Burkholderiales bacterium]|nr:DUF488 family protein [Burkholderiales bacterium]